MRTAGLSGGIGVSLALSVCVCVCVWVCMCVCCHIARALTSRQARSTH